MTVARRWGRPGGRPRRLGIEGRVRRSSSRCPRNGAATGRPRRRLSRPGCSRRRTAATRCAVPCAPVGLRPTQVRVVVDAEDLARARALPQPAAATVARIGRVPVAGGGRGPLRVRGVPCEVAILEPDEARVLACGVVEAAQHRNLDRRVRMDRRVPHATLGERLGDAAVAVDGSHGGDAGPQREIREGVGCGVGLQARRTVGPRRAGPARPCLGLDDASGGTTGRRPRGSMRRRGRDAGGGDGEQGRGADGERRGEAARATVAV